MFGFPVQVAKPLSYTHLIELPKSNSTTSRIQDQKESRTLRTNYPDDIKKQRVNFHDIKKLLDQDFVELLRTLVDSWRISLSRVVLLITTLHFYFKDCEFRLCAGSNSTQVASVVCDYEDFWQRTRMEIKRKTLSTVNNPVKYPSIHMCLLNIWYKYFYELVMSVLINLT